jgi:hypothetical protein
MGNPTKQNVLKGRNPFKNEKILTIPGRKGNTNQNQTRIPPHCWGYERRNENQFTIMVPAHPCLL